MNTYISRLKSKFSRLSRRAKWTLGLIVVLLFGLIIFALTRSPEEAAKEEPTLPFVRAQQLQDIAKDSTIEKTGIVKTAVSGPLVARAGGRVTAIKAHLGQTVGAGVAVVEIDGAYAPNPTRAGVIGAAESLAAFDAVKNAAIASANSTVQIAEINAQGIRENRPLTAEQAALARRLADVSVEQTRLALQDARDIGVDAAIRAADIANKQAQLSQDQATISRQLNAQQNSLSLEQAEANLKAAQTGRQRTAAELTSQRVQLNTQARVAQEQFKAQQVTAPVNGTVTYLTVLQGDFVTPGQIIGEVSAREGAYVRLQLESSVVQQLTIGRAVPIRTSNQSFNGLVTQIATDPNSSTGLFQVDIFITSTPKLLRANETVIVSLPASGVGDGTFFVPLDALNVREQGTFLLTVESDNRVAEHEATVINYSGNFAEVEADIAPDAAIIVEGGRTLRAGDLVSR